MTTMAKGKTPPQVSEGTMEGSGIGNIPRKDMVGYGEAIASYNHPIYSSIYVVTIYIVTIININKLNCRSERKRV